MLRGEMRNETWSSLVSVQLFACRMSHHSTITCGRVADPHMKLRIHICIMKYLRTRVAVRFSTICLLTYVGFIATIIFDTLPPEPGFDTSFDDNNRRQSTTQSYCCHRLFSLLLSLQVTVTHFIFENDIKWQNTWQGFMVQRRTR